jgi:dUTP pyrophosphatase
VEIKIMQLEHGVNLPLPSYHSQQASGMDLSAAVEDSILIAPGEIRLIPTALIVAIPNGFEGQIRPRSGLAVKYGITIVNAPGTIDSDYRGEIKVGLINLSGQAFTVQRGMRIAQLVIAPVARVIWQLTVSRDPTARGDGGFGHTG